MAAIAHTAHRIDDVLWMLMISAPSSVFVLQLVQAAFKVYTGLQAF